jgi:hypothetical protein
MWTGWVDRPLVIDVTFDPVLWAIGRSTRATIKQSRVQILAGLKMLGLQGDRNAMHRWASYPSPNLFDARPPAEHRLIAERGLRHLQGHQIAQQYRRKCG